jgi:hypothetical protein
MYGTPVSPKDSHGDAVTHICRYLLITRKEGLIFYPQSEQAFEVYAYADFCRNWNRGTAMNNMSTAKSRMGYIITFAGCPITWSSKLQTQIALITTDADYSALYQSLREVLHMVNLLTEINKLGITPLGTIPKIYCKDFEDNSGALELPLTKAPKTSPPTKHINLVYHNFQDFVRRGLIVIYPLGT